MLLTVRPLFAIIFDPAMKAAKELENDHVDAFKFKVGG